MLKFNPFTQSFDYVGGGSSFNAASPPPIGNVTPNTGGFKTLAITQGEITDPAATFNLTTTLNDAADTFHVATVAVSITNAHANSTLFRILGGAAGATNRFIIKADGQAEFTSSDVLGGLMSLTGPYGTILISQNGSPDLLINKKLGATALSVQKASGTITAFLEASVNHVLEQRNGANAQTFNVSNTYTDDSNYERATIRWTGNVLYFGSEYSGTGQPRDIAFIQGGTEKLRFNEQDGAWGMYGTCVPRSTGDSSDGISATGGSATPVFSDTQFSVNSSGNYTIGGILAVLKQHGLLT